MITQFKISGDKSLWTTCFWLMKLAQTVLEIIVIEIIIKKKIIYS